MDRNTIDNVITRINECTDGRFKYISGYWNKESKIKIKCQECGAIVERTYHHITTAGMKQCPECHRRTKEIAEREKEKARIERKTKVAERKAKREAEKAKRKAERMKPCAVCGKLTTNPKYCSKECGNKAQNTRRDLRRRTKIKNAMIDKDITVAGLFKRDNGVCYLCGGKCNTEDYIIRDNVFIAGDWYPSIDHVVPLVKGGKHAWNNVKLAHRICNSKKSSNEI